ncbi:MAG: LacI family DNA-binding transcriptional regulator [Cyclobacteriaceae bacterium]|nr:LacI family DNA-binding transcriptional regulator [Cyclobacteriaceae bacterium HetDA_MAG_MS6]
MITINVIFTFIMKSRTVTIKDIAKELGVSPSTVSRALNE